MPTFAAPDARCVMAVATWLLGWPGMSLAAGQAQHLPPAAQPPFELTVANVEVERGPFIDLSPTTDVSFQLTNRAATPLRDVVLEIAMVSETDSNETGTALVLAGPVVVRSSYELQPGFTMMYEMRLKNFSIECECHPVVKVASAIAVTKP